MKLAVANSKTNPITTEEACPDCQGTGSSDFFEDVPCQRCDGTGHISTAFRFQFRHNSLAKIARRNLATSNGNLG